MSQQKLLIFTTCIAFCVVVLGAYVRLSDAGLGCPDWPGCYGQAIVPMDADQRAEANAEWPLQPLDVAKAWKEMAHRYLAGLLGLLIAALVFLEWGRARGHPNRLGLYAFLLALVTFQALLGMWTVTLLLKPVVVMAHLLGGMTTLALLLLLTLMERGSGGDFRYGSGTRWSGLALLLLVTAQIALGGWTSANYAALACPDFPTCQGAWWPQPELIEGFVPWRALGETAAGTPLSPDALVGIHLLHRIGAVVLLLAVSLFGACLIRNNGGARLTGTAWAMIGVVWLQFLVGVGNVLLRLPLPLATAHNGIAALLLLLVVTINYCVWKRST